MIPRPPPDLRLARLAELLDGRYTFLSILGQGGAGRVYEVRNLALDRREALKVLSETLLDDGASERFAREARIAASLDHPGIVKIHSFGRNDGIHWYSMALVDGPTLADLVDAGRRLEVAMLAQVALPVLEALAYSHTQGVIHRDIKPANILFDPQGRPYLADFGIAKSEANAQKTQTGILMGTPAYVSPEQALGDPVDARTDQYSLGITLYKALTGRLPFSSENLLQTLVLRLNEEPEPLIRRRPDLGPELSAILMRTLARDRAHRWPDVGALRTALVGAFDQLDLPRGPSRLTEGLGPLARTPLPDLEVTAPRPESGQGQRPVPERGSFEPTAELAPVGRPGRFWWLAALGGLLAVVGAGFAWSKRGMRVPQAPSTSTPAAGVGTTLREEPLATPARATAAPASGPLVRKPSAESSPVLPPRPVVYPQLIEEPGLTPGAVPGGCAGLHVNLSLLVGEDGTVKQCKVLSAIRSECAEAAKAVALRYRFKPALDAQGKPIQTTVAAAVDFPESP